MPVDAYREKYGLPWSKALAGVEWRELKGWQLKRTRASGKIGRSPSSEHIKKLHQAGRKRRPAIEAAHKAAGEVLVRLGPRKKIVTAPERMEEYLRRIATGRTIIEVAADEDMPRFQSFYKHCSENPDFSRRFEAIWDDLPFATQIRGRRFGSRLTTAIDALLEQGKTWPEIAAAFDSNENEELFRLVWLRCRKSAA